jgi:hypothetical protein
MNIDESLGNIGLRPVSNVSEISGSYGGEYEDESFLGYIAV